MSELKDMKQIAGLFIANTQALFVFNEQIGPMADEHDRVVARQFSENVSAIVPGVRGVKPSIESGFTLEVTPFGDDEAEGEADQYDSPKQIEGPVGQQGNEGEESAPLTAEMPKEISAIARLLEDPDTARSLAYTLHFMARRPPVQGNLLRRGALTTLISFFEALVADLIRAYYSRHPAALPSGHQLTLEDLRTLNSVEDAEQFVTSGEVDKVLRDSFEKQLEYFSKQLKVDLSPLETELGRMKEIFQRRNVIVHNGGVANRQYLSKVPSDLITSDGVKEGDQLYVDEAYLANATDAVYVSGLVLVQQCWRKWDKGDKASIEAADKLAVNELYGSLLEHRFELATRLAQYTNKAPYVYDNQRRMAVINYAIALRELGRTNEMNSVLDEQDWSACAPQFKVALCALTGNEDEFYNILPKAVAADEFTKYDLENWPLFANLRGTQRFNEAVRECFTT